MEHNLNDTQLGFFRRLQDGEYWYALIELRSIGAQLEADFISNDQIQIDLFDGLSKFVEGENRVDIDITFHKCKLTLSFERVCGQVNMHMTLGSQDPDTLYRWKAFGYSYEKYYPDYFLLRSPTCPVQYYRIGNLLVELLLLSGNIEKYGGYHRVKYSVYDESSANRTQPSNFGQVIDQFRDRNYVVPVPKDQRRWFQRLWPFSKPKWDLPLDEWLFIYQDQ